MYDIWASFRSLEYLALANKAIQTLGLFPKRTVGTRIANTSLLTFAHLGFRNRGANIWTTFLIRDVLDIIQPLGHIDIIYAMTLYSLQVVQ